MKGRKKENKVKLKKAEKEGNAEYYVVENAEILSFATLENAVTFLMDSSVEVKNALDKGEHLSLPIYYGILTEFNRPIYISKEIKFDK